MKLRYLSLILLMVSNSFGAVSASFTGGTPLVVQGTNTMSHLDVNSTGLLTNAGVTLSREFISLQQVWANCPSPCTPSYTSIDGITTLAAARGYKLIVSIELTPPDLGASGCTPPSNNTTWATRAAAAIAHVDGLHPGLVLYWEVGNEYDLTGQFCPGSGTNLQAYIPLYTAAGPAMIAQVVADSSTALVGGPVLGAPATNAAAWLSNASTGLLGNTGTAPSVQFVDYHSYLAGCTGTWTTCFNTLQDAGAGQQALASSITTLVRAGTQPSASTTPIFVTESATSSAFSSDCCRNDATFGPLWDSISFMDWANSKITQADQYAAASSGSGTFFCLFWDPVTMTCSQPPLIPNSNFYFYQLVNSTSYLGASTGASLATSISPGTSTAGLQSSAFYTTTANVIIIANPTASPISTGTITFNNATVSNTAGLMYTLNASNATATPVRVSLTPIAGGFTAQAVSVPANTTVAFIAKSATLVPTAI